MTYNREKVNYKSIIVTIIRKSKLVVTILRWWLDQSSTRVHFSVAYWPVLALDVELGLDDCGDGLVDTGTSSYTCRVTSGLTSCVGFR